MNAQIYDALNSGTAFSNPLSSLSATSNGLITSGQASATGLSGIVDSNVLGALTAGGLTPARIAQSNTMFTNASTSVNTLVSYGDRTVNEAYSRIGTSVSYKSGLKSIGREPNNCDLINNAFGVCQTLGKQWLASLESALDVVSSKLADLYTLAKKGVAAGLANIQALAATVNSALTTAITAVASVAQTITDGIAAELAHIEGMISKCLNFSFANVLSEWYKDICAGGVIGSMGSSDLKNGLDS